MDLASVWSLSPAPAPAPPCEECPGEGVLAPSLSMWLLDMQKWKDSIQKCSRHPKDVVKGEFAVTFAVPRPGWTYKSQRRGLGSSTLWGQSLAQVALSRAHAWGEVHGGLA